MSQSQNIVEKAKQTTDWQVNQTGMGIDDMNRTKCEDSVALVSLNLKGDREIKEGNIKLAERF